MLYSTYHDYFNWLAGFVEGVAQDGNLQLLSECANDAAIQELDLVNFINDTMDGHRAKAVMDLSKFNLDLPKTIHSCNQLKNSTDIHRIVYWFTQFGNWDKVY